jgi:hypothetical protein
MLQYHLVFIGCSLEDEIIRIRRKLVADFRSSIPTAYAILPKSPLNEARSRFLASAALIEPIWYDAAAGDREHRALDDLLDQFGNIRLPEDIRSLMRFRKLSDRLARISPRNKRLLAYIATQNGRSIDLRALTDELQYNQELREKICSNELEDEIKHRLLYLMAIGLLWENETNQGPVFTIPTGLSNDDIQKKTTITA